MYEIIITWVVLDILATGNYSTEYYIKPDIRLPGIRPPPDPDLNFSEYRDLDQNKFKTNLTGWWLNECRLVGCRRGCDQPTTRGRRRRR